MLLYEKSPRGGLRVAACCEHARRRGVACGMPLAEASSLVSAHQAEHDALADRAALERLALWCEQFSPSVGLEDEQQPESLLLDITGLEPLFGSERCLAERVLRAFAKRDLILQVAVADTPSVAWALAHYAGDLSIVPSGDGLARLAGLPVESLRLPAKTVETLAELGIVRVEQLSALPRSSLASRFEPHLIQRLDQAAGIAQEPVLSYRALPEIVLQRRLEHPAESREAVDFVLAPLVEQLAAALAARRQGAIEIECRFDCQGCDPVQLVVGLFQASASPRHLLELLGMQIDQVTLEAPVTAVRLSVLLAAALEERQRRLFGDQSDYRRQLAMLVNRLSSRLDRTNVVRAAIVDDAQPEYAYRYEPLAGGAYRHDKRSKKLPLRPLLVEPQPRPVEVVCVVPEGPPVQFYVGGRPYRVLRNWGPERIQTGWWRGRPIYRDYYRLETDGGGRFWVFRCGDGRWFLQGVFD